MKRDKLKNLSFGRSIRTQTLLSFMVLSLVLISLLWAVQEWFFSTQFLRLKRNEIIREVEGRFLSYNPVQSSPDEFFSGLYGITLKNNLLIYYFSLKNSDICSTSDTINDDEGRAMKTVKSSFEVRYLLSPFVPEDQIRQNAEDDMFWDIRLSRFMYLVGLDNGRVEKQNTHTGSSYSAVSNKLYYAAEGQNNQSRDYRYFLYMEGVVSTEEITISLFRFEFALITLLCILLTLAFSLLLSQLMASPVARIAKRAESLAKGDFSVRFDKSGIRELNNLAVTLNYAAEEFGKTESMRREFLANISHDLRTPLTMVRAYAEMIHDLSADKPEKCRQHAQIIIDEADRLTHLVEDIQKLSKLQSGIDTLKETVFDLHRFCDSIIKQFSGFCEKEGFIIRYESPGSLSVSADDVKLGQVLYNLISNALNYTDKKEKTVVLKLTVEGKFALCEVIDNGKGIPPAEIDVVWERYYRANQEKRNAVGSGLGLSIVKSILTAHRAEFGVNSTVGKGTTFWFKLPLA